MSKLHPGFKAPMRLHSGVMIDLVNPEPDKLSLADLAYHTAGINRWTGGSRFTVAQHNVIVYRLSNDPWGLLHDCAEAIVGDVSHFLKRLLGDSYRQIEAGWSGAVSLRFGVPIRDVKLADQLAAQLEANYTWPVERPCIYDEHMPALAELYQPIQPWSAEVAEAVWLSEARKLGLDRL